MDFRINNRRIGENNPVYIIAEMSANHGGSFANAIKIIHVAKDAGADCIKTQVYTPDTMTIDSHNEYFKIDKGLWKGENLYSLYQKACTPWEWQEKIKLEAEKIGLDYLATPFDKTSVDFLEEIDIKFFKIASFELTDTHLIKYIASKNKPVIISTGMGSIDEIKEAIRVINEYHNNICLLKCSSAYPAEYKDMDLLTIKDMKERFNLQTGFSDHSTDNLSSICAVSLGASVIEKHICISKSIKTPDSSFSLTPEEFKDFIKDIRNTEKALGSVSYKLTKNEKQNKRFRRSIFVVKDIKKGDVFNKNNIRIIRPGYGLKPKNFERILGKKSKYDIKTGTPLTKEMIE